MNRELAWNSETVYALGIYEKYLGLIGLWPLNAKDFESHVRWSLAMLTQIISISSQSLEVYRHCVDLDDTMDAFLMFFSFTVSMSKLLLSRLNFRHTRTLVSAIVEDFSIPVHSDEQKVTTRYTTKGRFVSFTILYLGYASCLSFALRTLPLHRVLPTERRHDSNKTNHENSETSTTTTYFLSTYCVFGERTGLWRLAILLLQAMQLFVNATSHCGTDAFFFGIVMHFCAQFELLRMNFAALGANAVASSHKKIGLLVRRHCHLLRLTDDLEEAFSAIILVQLLMSSFLLCVEGFQMLISLTVNDTVSSSKHAVLIITMLVQLFLYSYAGDMLQSKTEELVLGVYDCPWYEFDANLVKRLSFVILHSRTPRRVTAGKFVSMNLFTFKEIIKTSASYMSVLRIMLAD